MAESLLYRTAQLVAGSWFELLHQTRLHGLCNVPRDGGFLLAANHASFYDPPLLGYGLPRPLNYFARKTLLSNPVGAWLLPRLHTIPVDRDGPADVNSLRRVLAAIKSGEGILVFPEGTRSPDGEIQQAKPGVGFLACKTGAPVVPARIFGTFESFGKGRSSPLPLVPIHVVYGKPIPASVYDGREADRAVRYENASRRILDAVRALQVPDERGA